MSFIDFLSLDFYGETWIVILRTLGVIISLPILYIFLKTIQSLRYALIDKRAMRKAFSLEISPKVTKQHFLVLGDSIAFGTGARDVHNSIVGRLARDYPEAHINNKAENGSHTIEIANKMHQIEEEFFDLAILIVGGNDILLFHSIRKMKDSLIKILTTLNKMTDNHVILVSPMNVGSSPIFWYPTNLYFSLHTRMVKRMFQQVADELGVTFVDLYLPKNHDPFSKNPDFYFARDHIHPCDEGYESIYGKIKKAIKTHRLVKTY